MVEDRLRKLRERLAEVYDLRYAGALLWWDQSTYLPSGGEAARGRQISTVERLAHEKFTDEGLGELLEALQPYEEELGYNSDAAALVRVTRREYERATRLPADFVAELSGHTSAASAVWRRARPANDFEMVRPYLEKTLDLSRRYAEFFPEKAHVADPLIEWSDPGMDAASVRAVFSELREHLVPLVAEISEQPPADDSCLRGAFSDARELAFAEEVVERFGYDFSRGRHDLTTHPFMTKLSLGDVRITTRVRRNDLRNPLFSTLHEAGHALYEQGIDREFEGTPLGEGVSAGVHESQSRLWENIVGRSRETWEFFYPRLQAVFPGELGSVTLDEFHRAINKVERSLIRTESDEVTYNLHVILRFDLELDLLEGNLEVRDLPQAWRERMASDLGVAPDDDRDGVLQDAHWFDGVIGGMFQGYTLGNIMSAQFYKAALEARPGIPDEARSGEFSALRGWLTENVYRFGSKYPAAKLLEQATGSSLDVKPLADYLRSKYGALYKTAG